MPLQIVCPHCFQSLLLPYTEAGLKVNCPNCHGLIQLTAAHEEKKPERRRTQARGDQWFFKAEDGSDFGPVEKTVLDQWFDEGRISADCQILHVGDEQWHWASDLFPELEEGHGETAQGAPLNRYDISDLLPPVIAAPAAPAGMYGLPGPLTTMGTASLTPDAPLADVPRMTRRLNEAVDPNVSSTSLYLDTLEKIEHRRGGHHPLVVATAVLNFIFGTYATMLGIPLHRGGLQRSGCRAADRRDWKIWAPMLPLALAGYGFFVLQTAIGLLNYQAWTIMATYIQAAISMTVSIVIIFIPVWLAFPPLLIFAVGGLVYGVLATIAVSIPWVIADFD
jgi:phage FluMu protein Com